MMQSPSRAAPGSIVGGRYALRTAIGHGGMGTVWRASDTVLRREVAVKEVVLPPGLALSDQEAMYERTHREARAAAGLSHPSIVQVFDVVTEDGRPWIVMELLDARSLADMVLEDGPLNPRQVAKIGIALLGALEIAHAGGVLHRDVKPANVLITSDGRCVLTDFGVAKLPADVQLTTPGMVLGSPHFISPERALGHRFGPPSDLFSLGVTLYTAVEGRPPFDKGDPLSTMHSVVEDPPLPPERCGPLIDVLYGLMEKDPDLRWDVATARGILRELLAGPLAQNANPQHVTDPYSVVPRQVGPPPVYAPPPPPGQKKVGGRAMLHTGETPATRRSAAPAVRHSTANYPAVEPKRKIDNKTRLAIGAGIAAVLLIVSVSFAMWDKDTKQTPAAQQKTSAPPSPTRSPGDDVSFGGMTVLGPKGWKQNTTSSWVDIQSPSDSGRRIRLNAVTAEKDAVKTLEYAQTVTLVNNCEEGLQPIEMRQAGLAGTAGMELEFMCNSKGKQRHGLWRVARIGESMRHVYLLTWEANFAEDKAYFETAVQSFRLV